MRVAVPKWCDRVSPVFDVAGRVMLVDIEEDSEVSREEVNIKDTHPAHRARHIVELGVNTLICGGISAPLEAMLLSAGVRVIPQSLQVLWELLTAELTK